MSIFWSVFIVRHVLNTLGVYLLMGCLWHFWLVCLICCKVQYKNLFDIEILLSALMCSVRVVLKKKKNYYSAARFMVSDDIEEEIVVLSGN